MQGGNLYGLASGDIEATPVYGPGDSVKRLSTIALDCDDPSLDIMGWNYGNSEHRIQQVAKKTPNKWGLYDMHGNMCEWCQDWYGDYPSAAVVNPVNPESGEKKVTRGGSYKAYARDCRSASRFWGWPNIFHGSPYSGLRIVRTV